MLLGLLLLVLLRQIWHGFSLVVSGVLQRNRSSEVRDDVDDTTLKVIDSGQIIATSHDLTPKLWFSKGNPLISGKSRLVKYYNLAR